MRGRIGMMLVALGLAIGVALIGLEQPVSAQATPVDVILGEFVFDPAELMVPAGPVTFNLTNTDSRRHNMVIDVNGTLMESETFGAGEAGSWEVVMDQPGTYSFWCSVTNHRERGMVATIMVH